jgi:hypothetical protein
LVEKIFSQLKEIYPVKFIEAKDFRIRQRKISKNQFYYKVIFKNNSVSPEKGPVAYWD